MHVPIVIAWQEVWGRLLHMRPLKSKKLTTIQLATRNTVSIKPPHQVYPQKSDTLEVNLGRLEYY